MAGKKSALGPTGETVASNVARLRNNANLSYAELSRQLTNLGRPIPELGLRNIEQGKRKVDVDELVALAFILATTPDLLMTPDVDDGNQAVESTPFGESSAWELWEWLQKGHRTDERGRVDIFKSSGGYPRFVLEGGPGAGAITERALKRATAVLKALEELDQDDDGDR